MKAGILAVVAAITLLTALVYSFIGWLLVVVINLFVAEPFSFGFWTYALIGLVIAILSPSRSG